jgi:hypothetical protein
MVALYNLVGHLHFIIVTLFSQILVIINWSLEHQSGVDLTVIKNWLGHVNLDTTHAYVEIDLEMKKKALSSYEPASKIDNLKHLIKQNITLYAGLNRCKSKPLCEVDCLGTIVIPMPAPFIPHNGELHIIGVMWSST